MKNNKEEIEKEQLMEDWAEIIETANNQDPKYSFELFKGVLDNTEKEINELKRRLKVLEDYDTNKIKKAKKEMLDDEIKFLEGLYQMGFNDGSRFQDMIEERLQKLGAVEK